MKFVLFYHSLLSDWNHGNAHFLRGIAAELIARGHRVEIYEPEDGWSLRHLLQEHGEGPLKAFAQAYPTLSSNRYRNLRLNEILSNADVVLVHEWNPPELIASIGLERKRRRFALFFHDTHHRAVTARAQMEAYDLTNYDGVLAFGKVLTDLYRSAGWAKRAWTWHEAADVRIFYPRNRAIQTMDVVWVGNWGDDERAAEIKEFFIEPVKQLGVRAGAYGVRYPTPALEALSAARINYQGWLPNFKVPQVFAASRATIHVPRRPYAAALPGIPTIRPFEALACGVPLISAFWPDSEHLFDPGKDFLVAHNGDEMKQHLKAVLTNRDLAEELTIRGRQKILSRHTCAHRVDELLQIHEELRL
jgi:spore maturation protein CgeB